jgi:hypothetical protein
MWPLGVFLLLMSGPQQANGASSGNYLGPLPTVQMQSSQRTAPFRMNESMQDQTCFTVRSYFFHRQDGQAPVLTGMTTCTPANLLRQRQASPAPRVMFVPVGVQGEQQK